MPQPTTHRGRDTKGRILSVAAALMYERGVSATSIEDILTASGTGKSQFYHYFTSKDDLIGHVLRHQLGRLLEQQDIHLSGTWSGITAWFDAITNAHETLFKFHGCPLGSIASEVIEQGKPLRSQAADAFAQWEASLSRELGLIQAQGLLGDDANPTILAETMIAIIQGGYLISSMKLDARPMRNALRVALDHLKSFVPTQAGEAPDDDSTTPSTRHD
ncbi:MAG: TetR/AcrR family transcriptional regulator [Pseudonocardiaceae bacterium]